MSESNGQDTIRQLKETRAQIKLLRAQTELATLQRRQKKLQEGNLLWDWMSGYQDLVDRLSTGDGRMLTAVSVASDRKYGANWPFWRTWQEHSLLRGAARVLHATNNQAQGALSGLTSFVVADGYKWQARPKDEKHPGPPGLVEAVQDTIDEFCAHNEWSEMEQELFRRSRRDGEFFLRYFPQDDGILEVATVEPEQVIPDPQLPLEIGSFGIVNAPGNVQRTEAFSVSYTGSATDLEEVPVSEMVHVKCNVDRSIKRGLTDFCYDTYDYLKIAGRLIENMGEGSAIQAAIAMIRQHEVATPQQVQGFVEDQADYQTANPMTGRNQSNQQVQSGTIFDIPKGMSYVPPPYSAGLALHTSVASMVMRSVGVKWNAPEWLISGDASATNYAASLTAESPFVRTCKRRQTFYGLRFKRPILAAVKTKADMGLLRANGQTFTWQQVQALVDVDYTAPTIETRNRLEEAQTNAIYVEMGAKSRQIVAAEQGYDFDQIVADNEEYQERMGPPKELPQPRPDAGLDKEGAPN